jgi:hypothetical protein
VDGWLPGEYVRGLPSGLPRENCRASAEYAGDVIPDRMRRLPERASWDAIAAPVIGSRRTAALPGAIRSLVTLRIASGPVVRTLSAS